MQGIFLFCRAGFESECAAEIQAHANDLGIYGYCKAKAESGYVIFVPGEADEAHRLHRELPFVSLIFSRQWFVVLAMRNDLPQDDRISPFLDDLVHMPAPAQQLVIETPDTNEAKELSGLCRSIYRPAQTLLQARGLFNEKQRTDALRCHICFMSVQAAYVGYSYCDNSSPWQMGIPRLKSPYGAPSRSTLKLDEAFFTFLTEKERERKLKPGMSAVDLGACPGGWTWQLVRRGLHVTAVDNGAMDERVMDTGLVAHLRVDGFRFQPEKPVDWMVCDIVESPMRTADLMARWLVNGWCRQTIFNLKLPMKKRWLELNNCLDHIKTQLSHAGIKYQLRARQLYHDREEVTVFIVLE